MGNTSVNQALTTRHKPFPPSIFSSRSAPAELACCSRYLILTLFLYTLDFLDGYGFSSCFCCNTTYVAILNPRFSATATRLHDKLEGSRRSKNTQVFLITQPSG